MAPPTGSSAGPLGGVILSEAMHGDYDDIADVMFEAVRSGDSLYSERQRTAWMPHRRSGDDWEARLDRQTVIVARDASRMLGFMSIDPAGYIDFAYIRPEAQRTGLFRRLFERIEQHSRARGDARMWVHASLMAQPAFAALGFEVVEHQAVRIGDESFERAEMEKRRSPGARNVALDGRTPCQVARSNPNPARAPQAS
ncbi:GNAT family N-acetyltransferase [Sphingomonas baiyangensis]|uniref:GNAT family N-acetyltransferase n=1 Tax=Sphingomonas baiyangensis TaxID=2572576 RepID=A0A4V5PUB3_9SPHN|nr:GNAT family N-acetyltransferase [Sphingomonas baiyangensis]TKD52798.1 GNAT family N-acetyltransferase [Sphingomonas baiyangensis]